MPGPAPAYAKLRFGIFELDPETGELRKSGVLIHLPPQPFRVLCILAGRPFELVTREELRRQVWGADTFVDFEHGLNTAIKKIRDALADNPEHPHYIETVPRRGHRFIAPVDTCTNHAPALATDREDPVPRRKAPLYEAPRWRLWAVVAALGVVLAIAAVFSAYDVGAVRDHLLTFLRAKGATLPPRIESIAVLPFENLSGDPEQEYFADGLTDALITDLGKVGTLRVISRTSVMRYKSVKKPLPEIARELNVDAVVEGTVQRSGNRIRIRTQLVEARTDRHLWAESYERSAQELAQLEEQSALAVAREVSGRLSPAQETRLAAGRPVNPAAYNAYLRGRVLWGTRSPEAENQARAYFEQALREDPSFAPAYSGLADFYGVSWGGPLDEPRAEQYARKALELDPDLAEAHASLGVAELLQHKMEEAGRELQKAIQLNPNYAPAHHWYGFYLLWTGRINEALAENGRARQLDPFSLPVNGGRALMLIALHDYDGAIAQTGTVLAINPQMHGAHFLLARIYWLQGKVPEAIAEERTAATMTQDSRYLRELDEIAAAYRRSGPRGAELEAAKLTEKHYNDVEASGSAANEPSLGFEVARRYALLKDKKRTLEWLERAVRQPAGGWVEALSSAPEFEFVHSEPTFQDVLGRLFP